jgi:hypothetical protein
MGIQIGFKSLFCFILPLISHKGEGHAPAVTVCFAPILPLIERHYPLLGLK